MTLSILIISIIITLKEKGAGVGLEHQPSVFFCEWGSTFIQTNQVQIFGMSDK